MRQCIVMGAGILSRSRIPIQKEDYVIAVDGGMEHCRRLGVEPDLYIGDFDSLSVALQAELKQIEVREPKRVIRLQPEKDDTDMLAACKAALERGFTDFVIYAATGGRLDHTLANIQCLLYLKRHGADGTIVDAENRITVIENETVILPSGITGMVSLFAMGDTAKGVTLEGLKYPLQEYTVTNDFPIGISNEFTGEEVNITVRDGALAVIIQENIK